MNTVDDVAAPPGRQFYGQALVYGPDMRRVLLLEWPIRWAAAVRDGDHRAPCIQGNPVSIVTSRWRRSATG